MTEKLTYRNRQARTILFISLGWLLIYILIDPIRDFPLNDDWSYSLTVKYLVEDGKYILNDWLAGPMATQMLWGALFCIPFGFSFSALTISTLVLGLAGIIFTYLLIRMISGSEFFAILSAAIIMTNPLYVNLSATFMTDIPFYAFSVISLYYYFHFQKYRDYKSLYIGIVFALLATFIRQYGLIIPMAFLFTEALYLKQFGRKSLIIHFVGLTIILTAYILYGEFLDGIDQKPRFFRSPMDLLTDSVSGFLWKFFTRTGAMLIESGLWLFPLVIYWISCEINNLKKHYKTLLVVLVIFLFPMIRVFGDMPGGNILFDTGLGPLTTMDIYFGESSPDIFSIPYIWYIIRAVALMGGISIVLLANIRIIELFKSGKDQPDIGQQKDHPVKLTSIALILLYSGISMISFTYFDRYIIPLLLMAMMFLPNFSTRNESLKTPYAMISIITMILFLSFGILGTRFYLSWNNTKWELVQGLIESGIEATSIDGGHEVNGWYGAEMDKQGRWNTENMIYVITFSELNGYKVLVEHKIPHSIRSLSSPMYVLKRED